MTLDELVAQLLHMQQQGHGDKQIIIYDEDEGITKDIQSMELWERAGKPTTIDINVGK